MVTLNSSYSKFTYNALERGVLGTSHLPPTYPLPTLGRHRHKNSNDFNNYTPEDPSTSMSDLRLNDPSPPFSPNSFNREMFSTPSDSPVPSEFLRNVPSNDSGFPSPLIGREGLTDENNNNVPFEEVNYKIYLLKFLFSRQNFYGNEFFLYRQFPLWTLYMQLFI